MHCKRDKPPEGLARSGRCGVRSRTQLTTQRAVYPWSGRGGTASFELVPGLV